MATFSGKIALVTGGSQGIGLSVVLRLTREGATVLTCGRSRDKWQASLLSFPELEAVRFTPTDLGDDRARESLFDIIDTEYGRLDIAINSASPAIASAGPFVEVENSAIKGTLDSDLFVPLICIKRELMLMAGGGAIVNVSSINGLRPTPSAAAYCIAKHGLEAATKSLALEHASKGVRINAVAPGVTMTPRWQKRLNKAPDSQQLKTAVEESVPLGRFAAAEEVASAIIWLCSAEASYVVGHTLVVDGGLSQR